MEGHIDTNCPVTGSPCPQLEGISVEYFRPVSDYEYVEDGADVRAQDIILGQEQAAEIDRAARERPSLCIETDTSCGVARGWEMDQTSRPLSRKTVAVFALKRLLTKEA